MERLPGREVVENVWNTSRIKIVHQNIKGLFTNVESLTLHLKTYKIINIVTLCEIHVMCNSCNNNSGLYYILGFMFVSKCHQNFEEIKHLHGWKA